ncbi:hypothetical protein GCM10009641_85680 [Mycobacterium cookii]|uniref:Uncharacterized protein n=1 Tax=Nocardioides furvisabuli TaxID=375542 RepID=A0ABP5J4H2_9ACTN
MLALSVALATGCAGREGVDSINEDGEARSSTPPTSAKPNAPSDPGPQRAQVPAGAVIPSDFALAEGWPGPGEDEGGPNGLEGPSRKLPPLTLTACGTTIFVPNGSDRLSAVWTNPEDHRSRMLLTFGSAVTAREYAASVTDLYRSCPTQDTGDGYTTLAEVVTTDLTEDSAAVVLHYLMGTEPAVGLGLVQVVRSGTAVLVETGSNEGGSGSRPEEQRRQYLRESTAALHDVVDAMSAFGSTANRNDRAAAGLPSWSPAAPEGPDGAPLELGNIVLGGIEPVEVGRQVSGYIRQGYLVADQDPPCEGNDWLWRGELSDGLYVSADQDGTISALGTDEDGLETADGIGVGSSHRALMATYGELLAQVRADDQGVGWVFVKEGADWIAFSLGPVEQVTDTSRVDFIEVGRGEVLHHFSDAC